MTDEVPPGGTMNSAGEERGLLEPRDPSGLPVTELDMICTCDDDGRTQAAALHAQLDELSRLILGASVRSDADWIEDYTRILSELFGSVHAILSDQWHLVAIRTRQQPEGDAVLGPELIIRVQCDSVRDGLAAVLLHQAQLRPDLLAQQRADS